MHEVVDIWEQFFEEARFALLRSADNMAICGMADDADYNASDLELMSMAEEVLAGIETRPPRAHREAAVLGSWHDGGRRWRWNGREPGTPSPVT